MRPVSGPSIADFLFMRTGSLRSQASWTMAAATLLVALGNLGCGSSSPPDTGQVARSSLARVTAPVVSTDDASTLASDNLGFAVDLYQALRSKDGNLVFSPSSISIALAMTYAGAATTTASEIASTLHFTMPPERLHLAFDALDLALTTPPAGGAPNAFALKIANATWGQRGFAFLSSYLDLLAQDYGAGLRTVDFEAASEPSRVAINAWVSEQTEQRIPQILPAGSIDPATLTGPDRRRLLPRRLAESLRSAEPYGHVPRARRGRQRGDDVERGHRSCLVGHRLDGRVRSLRWGYDVDGLARSR